MKKLLVLLFLTTSLLAGEGKWTPQQVLELDPKWLAQQGLELPPSRQLRPGLGKCCQRFCLLPSVRPQRERRHAVYVVAAEGSRKCDGAARGARFPVTFLQ
jgi:hypothetical protein